MDITIKTSVLKQEPGQEVLVSDLKELLAEAEAGEFGDFTNKRYAAPKMQLRAKFLAMAEDVVSGRYD